MADEKKIIIDEDWKAQVQAEKETAAQSTPKPAGPPPDMPMPPASLEMLITTLVTEAMISLGQVPHSHTGEPVFHPQQAKYIIDTIAMLCEKTQGNVTPEESSLMENLLHQLRMAYVQLSAAAQSAAPSSHSDTPQ